MLSAMIIVRPSGVITVPFGKCRSSAAGATDPSGRTRASTAVGSGVPGARCAPISKPKLPT